MAQRGMGALGWFSLAGAVTLGVLYVLERTGMAGTPMSERNTAAVASLAGIGAALFYYGNDPTREEARRAERERVPA